MSDDINDDFNGMNIARKKFNKLFPQDEIRYISYGALNKTNIDNRINRLTSPFFHSKGTIILSENRIYFKSAFLSPAFFLFAIGVTIFTPILPFIILTLGDVFPNINQLFLIILILASLAFMLFNIAIVIRQFFPLTLNHEIHSRVVPGYYKRRMIIQKFEFISFTENNYVYHIYVDKQVPDSVKVILNGG